MVICFACSPETKAQLDRLVATGHYHDHSEAIAAAVQNLVVIHSELKDSGSIVIDRGRLAQQQETQVALSQGSSTTIEPDPVAPSATRSNENPSPTRQPSGQSSIPALFQRRADVVKPAQFAGFKTGRRLCAQTG